MFCHKCGSQSIEGAAFCNKCGMALIVEERETQTRIGIEAGEQQKSMESKSQQTPNTQSTLDTVRLREQTASVSSQVSATPILHMSELISPLVQHPAEAAIPNNQNVKKLTSIQAPSVPIVPRQTTQTSESAEQIVFEHSGSELTGDMSKVLPGLIKLSNQRFIHQTMQGETSFKIDLEDIVGYQTAYFVRHVKIWEIFLFGFLPWFFFLFFPICFNNAIVLYTRQGYAYKYLISKKKKRNELVNLLKEIIPSINQLPDETKSEAREKVFPEKNPICVHMYAIVASKFGVEVPDFLAFASDGKMVSDNSTCEIDQIDGHQLSFSYTGWKEDELDEYNSFLMKRGYKFDFVGGYQYENDGIRINTSYDADESRIDIVILYPQENEIKGDPLESNTYSTQSKSDTKRAASIGIISSIVAVLVASIVFIIVNNVGFGTIFSSNTPPTTTIPYTTTATTTTDSFTTTSYSENETLDQTYIVEKGSVYIEQADDTVIIATDGQNITTIDGYYINFGYYHAASLDGTKAAAIISNEPYGSNENSILWGLYYITDAPQLIARDIASFKLSASGSAVVYDNGKEELWLYDGSNATHISEYTSYYLGYAGYVISPDGKSVLYNSDNKLYLWNGSIVLIGENFKPVAVSDGSAYIYFSDNDNAIYAQKGSDKNTRMRLGEHSPQLYFNNDMSQVILDYDDSIHLCHNAEKLQPISGNSNFRIQGIILPENVATVYYNTAFSNMENDHAMRYSGIVEPDKYDSYYDVYIIGILDFRSIMFWSQDDEYNDSVIRINSQYEVDYVIKDDNNIDTDTLSLATDGKTLTYRNWSDDRIYQIDALGPNAKPRRISEDDIEDFAVTYDGGAMYYINGDDVVYYQTSTSVPSFVDISIDTPFGVFNNGNLYYIKNGELYVSSGEKGSLTQGISGYIFGDIEITPSAILINALAGDDILYYRSTNGTDFYLMFREINGTENWGYAADVRDWLAKSTSNSDVSQLTAGDAQSILQKWLDVHSHSFYDVYIADRWDNDDDDSYLFVLYRTHEFGYVRVDKVSGELYWSYPDEEDILLDDWYSENYGDSQPIIQGVILYSGKPLLNWLGSSLTDLRGEFGNPDIEGVVWEGETYGYQYNRNGGITFNKSKYGDDIEAIWGNPANLTYHGDTLNTNREGLVSLFGTPIFEDWNDDYGKETYYMLFYYQDKYSLAFESTDPDDKANEFWISYLDDKNSGGIVNMDNSSSGGGSFTGKYTVVSFVYERQDLVELFDSMGVDQDSIYIELLSGGKFNLSFGGFEDGIEGTYKVNGKNIVLTAEDKDIQGTLDGNKITIEKNGTKLVFEKKK